jgi:hypothetical protein
LDTGSVPKFVSHFHKQGRLSVQQSLQLQNKAKPDDCLAQGRTAIQSHDSIRTNSLLNLGAVQLPLGYYQLSCLCVCVCVRAAMHVHGLKLQHACVLMRWNFNTHACSWAETSTCMRVNTLKRQYTRTQKVVDGNGQIYGKRINRPSESRERFIVRSLIAERGVKLVLN